jgi:hypothetical protein
MSILDIYFIESEFLRLSFVNKGLHAILCYWSQWSVDKMVSYLIGGVMVSILALSVLDPWDRAPVWSNQRL